MNIKKSEFYRGYGDNIEYPKVKKVEWIDDKTITMSVKLKPATKYSVRTSAWEFVDSEGNFIPEEYQLDFETK